MHRTCLSFSQVIPVVGDAAVIEIKNKAEEMTFNYFLNKEDVFDMPAKIDDSVILEEFTNKKFELMFEVDKERSPVLSHQLLEFISCGEICNSIGMHGIPCSISLASLNAAVLSSELLSTVVSSSLVYLSDTSFSSTSYSSRSCEYLNESKALTEDPAGFCDKANCNLLVNFFAVIPSLLFDEIKTSLFKLSRSKFQKLIFWISLVSEIWDPKMKTKNIFRLWDVKWRSLQLHLLGYSHSWYSCFTVFLLTQLRSKTSSWFKKVLLLLLFNIHIKYLAYLDSTLFLIFKRSIAALFDEQKLNSHSHDGNYW